MDMGILRNTEEGQAMIAMIEQVLERYKAPDAEQVKHAFASDPNIPRLLLEAVPQIERVFSEQPVLSLEIEEDDTPAARPQVFVSIYAHQSDIQTAMDLLNRFETEWWFERLASMHPSLMFDVECA